VRFIAPLGIAALATIQRRAPEGARIILVSIPPYLEVVVRRTALNDLFEIGADVEEALAKLSDEHQKAANELIEARRKELAPEKEKPLP